MNKENKPLEGGGCASRLNGKAALQEAIDRIETKVRQYKALLAELPDDLSCEADEALWLMSINIQR